MEQVTAAAEERQHSVHTLTAYRRTWLKLLAWAAARWGADFAGSALVFPRWGRRGHFSNQAFNARIGGVTDTSAAGAGRDAAM